MKQIILFFDTETTGIRKNGFIPRVVQIGALLADEDGKTISELNILLQPEGFSGVPPQAANVHGFTTGMVQAFGVDRKNGLSTFFDLVENADILVAHNNEYDLDLMQIEIDCFSGKLRFDGHGIMPGHAEKWQEQLNSVQNFCTMQNTRDILKLPLSAAQASFFKDTGNDQQYKNPRLIEAYNHFFGKDFEGAHDAMADVRACRDVYFELHKLKA